MYICYTCHSYLHYTKKVQDSESKPITLLGDLSMFDNSNPDLQCSMTGTKTNINACILIIVPYSHHEYNPTSCTYLSLRLGERLLERSASESGSSWSLLDLALLVRERVFRSMVYVVFNNWKAMKKSIDLDTLLYNCSIDNTCKFSTDVP